MIAATNVIVAHRGLHDQLPENSLAAMLAAWDAGINWCECDVHLSADGIPVVIHDETLERTTTGHGKVADHKAADLTRLRLLDADGKETKHHLPLLDELFEESKPGRYLLVETKPLLGKRIYPIAKKIQKKQGMIQSFHLEDMVLALKATMNRCPTAVLVHECEGNLSKDFPGKFHVHHESLSPLALRSLGRVGVWTVNEPDHIRHVTESGRIEMIITDMPLLVKQILEKESETKKQRILPYRSAKLSGPSPKKPRSRK